MQNGEKMDIQVLIRKLVSYGVQTGLVPEEDVIYTTNRLLELFELDELEERDNVTMREDELEEVLKGMLDYAYEKGILKENSVVYRDLFDTKIMGMLMPRPSEVIRHFHELYEQVSPEAATDYYYKLSRDSDYIRRYRICKDMTLLSTCPSLRRIPRLLLQRSWQNRPVIRNACCAVKMKVMQAV